MFNWEENHFLQLFLGFFEASDILPFGVRHFHNGFTERGRIHGAHGEFEVVLTDAHLLQNLRIDFLVVNIEEIHLFTDTLERGFSAKLGHISTHETVRVLGHGREVDIIA